jgi:hypothetical protein
MPARRTALIKKALQAFERRKISPVVDYTVKSFGDSAGSNLSSLEEKRRKD